MKLFLVDGHALIFKMYYAFLGRPMISSKGADTSILFGFTKYLLEMILRERPDALAVAFDPPGGTFRNELYHEYKANRGETPQLVIDALDPLCAILKAMNVPVLMFPGFEADDVIGSASKAFAGDGTDVYMVTPDKDFGQLVSSHIFQYRPGKSGSENEILSGKEVCAKWNISSTQQVIDILAICGDAADNVPGVQGVGPVGAAKLLAKYGSVEEIYSHLSELSSRQQALFEAARSHIALSKELVTIKTDIPLGISRDELKLKVIFSSELETLFDEYEFPSLKRNLRLIASQCSGGEAQSSLEEHHLTAPSLTEISKLEITNSKTALSLDGGTLCVVSGGQYAFGEPELFRDIIENKNITKVGHSLKPLLKDLSERGMELRGRMEDVSLMHYLLNPEKDHSLEALSREYLGVELFENEDNVAAEEKREVSLFDTPAESDGSSVKDRAKALAASLALSELLSAQIDSTEGMRNLYDNIEEPLIRVLSKMERTGVKVDLRSLDSFAASLRAQMLEKEARVRQIAGEPNLNVSSPKQVGAVLYEKLALDPKRRKSKTGSYPTDEQTLLTLADKSPIVDAILDYRGLKKLLSTYIEPFHTFVSPLDGRVHTTFNQTLTSTGRLSSSNPNLQNIPIRTDEGKEIRRAFVAGSEDCVMMSADYSQIELRLMAHFCGDEHLIAAFKAGEDIHAATASKIFRKPSSEVSSDERRVAKTANFGIMYGISAFGLGRSLHCSRQEAAKIIDDYFASFPSIRDFITATIDSARKRGCVETLFGRRRYLPDINSANTTLRSLAERNAVNAPIQGSAADIIKMAMCAVDRSLTREGARARMVLQIHDELLVEVPKDEIDKVRQILTSDMENIVKLSVPLTVECNYGKTWLDAH